MRQTDLWYIYSLLVEVVATTELLLDSAIVFERRPTCTPQCAINAACYEYYSNFKDKISECRCQGTMGKAEYWDEKNGANGEVCKPVVGPAKGHTWLAHDTTDMVESFIKLYLDEHFHLVESDIKNFDRRKKSKAIHDFALRLSTNIKNHMASSSDPTSKYITCLRPIDSTGLIIGSFAGTTYRSTGQIRQSCERWQRDWEPKWQTSLKSVAKCYTDIVDFVFVKDRKLCIGLHKQMKRMIQKFEKVMYNVCKRKCLDRIIPFHKNLALSSATSEMLHNS